MITINSIENFLNILKKTDPELQNVSINYDTMHAKKIALARVSESGTIETLTDYLTLKEMNQFLRGYYFKLINKFNN